MHARDAVTVNRLGYLGLWHLAFFTKPTRHTHRTVNMNYALVFRPKIEVATFGR